MPIALLAALGGSLMLHVAALFGLEIDLSTAPDPEPIRAELTIPVKPVAPEPPPPHSKPPRKSVPRTSSVARHEAVPVASVAPTPTVVAEPPPPVVPVAEPAPRPEPAPVTPLLPSQGRIRFAVFKGQSGFEIGRAEQSWQFADGRYELHSVTETSGLVALFKPVRVELVSRGTLVAGGLQPEQFRTLRNGKETNENADFDWSAASVTLQRDGSVRPLSKGGQDLLSFHYQLAYLGRLADGVAMSVVTGKKLERYAFDSLGEEDLDTPVGRLRTLHLRVQTDSVTEVWLAVERRMLPVKMRHTDRKGDSFEQVVVDLGPSE